MNWLTARPIAHRGLHGGGVIENTLAAARAAIAQRYAIECDVQLTVDGEAVVFHDAMLERLTNGIGRVSDHTLAQLIRLALKKTDAPPAGSPPPTDKEREFPPTLTELLTLIAGQVPLICEIKSEFDGDLRLAERAAEIARGYDGPLAFKSFDPEPIAHLRANHCPRPLGIVAEASYNDPYFDAMTSARKHACAAFLHINQTQPDFLSWSIDDLPHATPSLMRALGRKPVLAWTVRRPEQWQTVSRYADQAIFEGETPAG